MDAEFFLVYQPMVNVASGATLGLEALVRWAHPSLGELGPDLFIGVAETAGLIWALGAWVLRTACRDAATWPPLARVAVNLSPLQLHDERLVATVLETLADTGLDPARLELEVSERIEPLTILPVAGRLAELRACGIRVMLDDFGTHGANLARLMDLPLDGIKLDRGFLAAIDLNTGARTIINAVIELAAGLELDVVAEGVETEAHLDLLTAAGCQMAQGFLFQHPLPMNALPSPWRTVAV